MGNIIGAVSWTSCEKDDIYQKKIEEIASHYDLIGRFSKYKNLNDEANQEMVDFIVEIGGLSLLTQGRANVSNKIKLFLFEVKDVLNKEGLIDVKTTFENLPL